MKRPSGGLPDTKTNYLGYQEIRYIHLRLVDVFFSAFKDETTRYAILNDHAIHAAADRPRNTWEGRELYPTLYLKAAALIHSLIKSHPFIDANKRTGMLSGLVFLAVNNVYLSPDQGAIY